MGFPRHLYKFLSNDSKHFHDALIKLAEGKVWFSEISKQNDPWEGIAPINARIPALLELLVSGAHYTDEQISNIKGACEKTLQLAREKWGIFSCSKGEEGNHPLHNMLLWSHYANGGQGVCIKFESVSSPGGDNSIFHAGDVQYKDEVDYIGSEALNFIFSNDANRMRGFVDLAMLQKPDCWEYETEYRFVSDKVGYVPLIGYIVSAIYFGPRVGKCVKCVIKEVFPGVQKYETKIGDGYALDVSGPIDL